MNPALSIVVPVYRNAATLEELHRQLTAALAGFDYEMVFVNDGAPDQSLDILRGLAAADSRVGVLSLSRNVGQNAAVMWGLRYAAGQIAVVLDADLQDPPAAIVPLVETLKERRAACVFAGRRGQYSLPRRLLTSRLFKLALHILSGLRLPVDAGLFLAMDRRMIDCLRAHDPHEVYVLSLIARPRLPLTSIPVARQPSSETNYTFRMRLKLGWRAARSMLGWKKNSGESLPTPTFEFIGEQFRQTRVL